MPVVRTSEASMKSGNRPDWCSVTAAGVFRVSTEGGRFDCHFHDCDEYWLIYKGKARVMSEGNEFYVKPGDIVSTRAGDEHDCVEIYEDLEAFYFEDATPEGGRTGHLHRDDEKAKGRSVPHKPLPANFPT